MPHIKTRKIETLKNVLWSSTVQRMFFSTCTRIHTLMRIIQIFPHSTTSHHITSSGSSTFQISTVAHAHTQQTHTHIHIHTLFTIKSSISIQFFLHIKLTTHRTKTKDLFKKTKHFFLQSVIKRKKK